MDEEDDDRLDVLVEDDDRLLLVELLVRVEDVLTLCEELDSVDSVDGLLLDSEEWLLLELVADDVLLDEALLVLLDERLDSEDEEREWLLLDVLFVTLLSDPVEKLDDSELSLLVLFVRLEELLLSDESVDSEDSLDIDCEDLLLIDDSSVVLVEELLAEEVLDEDRVLLLRLDTLLLLVLALEVLLVLSDEVLDDDSDDAVLVLSDDVLIDDVEDDDRLLALEDDSSSTPMIRNSCCEMPSCCGPLVTIRSSSSLVGKSRMAGANSTPPMVSRNSARHSKLSAIVIVSVSVVLAMACVVR